jgi:hypothetical protein
VQPRPGGAARVKGSGRTLLAFAFAIACVCSAVTAATAPADVHGTRATAMISRNANGPSEGGSFSQDGRRVSYYAFTSAASNLAGGDTNGMLDVFALHRDGLGGSIQRVSVATGGAQANGDSSNPSVDGDTHHAPHCIAFQSSATNLDPRDPTPDSDVFVHRLGNDRTRLVSVGADSATNPSIDGACRTVTYEAGGAIFVADLDTGDHRAIAPGTQPDQQTDGHGVVYVRDGQVWLQRFRPTRHGIQKRGGERLVSAGAAGAGNGSSSHPSVNDDGGYVAFESTATNLCDGTCAGVSGDRNGAVSDVFRRTMGSHEMQMVSYSHGADAQGNAPSNNPAISSAGQFVLFDSAASNLRPTSAPSDPNGHTRDVFLWNFPRGRGYGNVSRESRPQGDDAFNAPSVAPAVSAHGNYVAFTTQAGRAAGGGGGSIPNVFMRFLGGA